MNEAFAARLECPWLISVFQKRIVSEEQLQETFRAERTVERQVNDDDDGGAYSYSCAQEQAGRLQPHKYGRALQQAAGGAGVIIGATPAAEVEAPLAAGAADGALFDVEEGGGIASLRR